VENEEVTLLPKGGTTGVVRDPTEHKTITGSLDIVRRLGSQRHHYYGTGGMVNVINLLGRADLEWKIGLEFARRNGLSEWPEFVDTQSFIGPVDGHIFMSKCLLVSC